jgi:hypothetical protein
MAVASAKTAKEQCPWCGSVIPHEKFLEVQERIRAEEKKQHETIAGEMKEQYEEKLSKASTDLSALQLKHTTELAEATAAAKKAAEDAATVKATADAQRMRELLDEQHQAQMLTVKAEAAKLIEEAQRKLAEIEGKVGQDEVPVNVLESLQVAFEDDRIIPVPVETGGNATIIIEVKSKSSVCGKIVIDGRGRNGWQTNFTKKLHDEMLEEKAEHAVLASYKLPGGESQICEHNGVLVVHPARIVEIVRILRRSMVLLFQARASSEQRGEKKAKLYDFITSTPGQQRLKETGTLVKQLQTLHVQETKEHENIWKKRGEIERKIQKNADGLLEDLEEILEGKAK